METLLYQTVKKTRKLWKCHPLSVNKVSQIKETWMDTQSKTRIENECHMIRSTRKKKQNKWSIINYLSTRQIEKFSFFQNSSDKQTIMRKKMCYTLLSIIKMQQNANRRNEENRNSIKGLNMIYYKLYN